MQDSLIILVPLALLALGAAGAAWLRSTLATLRLRVIRAEHLAASRARSLALAAQELRGIAAGMAGCPGRASGSDRSFCAVTPGGFAHEPMQKMLRLADDLVHVAAESTTRVIHDAPARLGPIVDAAVAAVGAQIQPGHRYWLIDPALRALTFKADGRALQGALSALLRRAASHSRDGDVIALRWVVTSETVSIVVEDEGDGLAAADLVPEAGTSGHGTRGLDLGLSLARSLAAAHGGDIRLESAPGIGARAWLTLPRARMLAEA